MTEDVRFIYGANGGELKLANLKSTQVQAFGGSATVATPCWSVSQDEKLLNSSGGTRSRNYNGPVGCPGSKIVVFLVLPTPLLR